MAVRFTGYLSAGLNYLVLALALATMFQASPNLTSLTRRFALTATMFACASCPRQPLEEGATARAGFRRTAPVIAALEEYRETQGRYPDSLPALVPEYLDRNALAIPTPAALRYPLQYTLEGAGYRLGFRFTGPGINQCWYLAGEARWHCTGH